jgi:peptide chain release factor subunit 1
LEFVTDRSSEGTQFVKGFGGIGGILRWKVDFVEMSSYDEAANLDHGEKGEDDDDGEDSDAGSEYGFDDGEYGF